MPGTNIGVMLNTPSVCSTSLLTATGEIETVLLHTERVSVIEYSSSGEGNGVVATGEVEIAQYRTEMKRGLCENHK